MENVEKEISKEEFKELYFKYQYCDQNYWDHGFEGETDKKYFVVEPEDPTQIRMFIVSDKDTHRAVFMTEDSEESFFDYPGKI
jgi:hypothetical protein